MRVLVQLDFGVNLDGAVKFLEGIDKEFGGRILMDASGAEIRRQLDAIDEEDGFAPPPPRMDLN